MQSHRFAFIYFCFRLCACAAVNPDGLHITGKSLPWVKSYWPKTLGREKDKVNWWTCQGIIKLLKLIIPFSITSRLKGSLRVHHTSNRLKMFLFELLSVFVVSSVSLVSNGSKFILLGISYQKSTLFLSRMRGYRPITALLITEIITIDTVYYYPEYWKIITS